MICRKIVYQGQFTRENMDEVITIVRRIEITGVLRHLSGQTIELALEGDASMIKLIQHQVERRLEKSIKKKDVTTLPYQHYQGIDVIPLAAV